MNSARNRKANGAAVDPAEELADLRRVLREREEALLAVQRREAAKDELLGIVGHDLRTPLHAIVSYARLEAMSEDLPSHTSAGLDRIIANGMRMQRMIEQILDRARDGYSGGIPVALVEQLVAPIVQESVEEARTVRPDRIFELGFEPEGWERECVAAIDADRLEQVLSNLLENAVTHGAGAAPVRIVMRHRANEVVVDIQNQGPVLDPARIPSLFEPFKRTGEPRSRSAGLGLGLYIADRIIRAHHGRLAVTSSIETGTVFSIELPCV